MKAKLSILILLLSIPLFSFAEENQQVNWDKIEAALYEKLKAENLYKTDAEIHQVMGHVLLKSDNQWERAVMHFKKAVEMDPELYFSWYNLGLMDPDAEEGRDCFKKCIKSNPAFPPAYYWLGYSLCRNKRDKEALPIFEEYLKAAKDDPKEKDRFIFASKLIKELQTGKEGKNSKMIRMAE